MKNKKNLLVKKTLANFLAKLGIWTLVLATSVSLFIFVINFSDFQWVYNFSPKIYYSVKSIVNSMFEDWFWIWVIIIWFIGFIIISYNLIKKVFSYVSAISEASEKLLNKDVEYIELPVQLEELQIKMNHLKRKAEKNEQLARESEQKKNDLIVYLAHDLKTPLTSIIGYLSLLDEIKDMPKKKREKYVSIVLEKAYRLEDLINELFDIARFNSENIILEIEEINLTLLLEQIIDDFYPLLNEKNKTIKFDHKKKIIINGDSNKLARVFGNLIKNAINYSTDDLINIDILIDNTFATVIISNKGKKIPENKLNKIFEKFYRADSSRTSKTGGSGLGLAISKEIVELHGGNIWANSDEEKTSFLVKLPIKKMERLQNME